VRAREREHEALELRKAGATYQQIADRMRVSRQAVHQLVKRALHDLVTTTAEDAAEVRALETERLDMMLLGLWNNARSGDPKAVAAVIRIMERRACLFGIDLVSKDYKLPGVDPGTISRRVTVSENAITIETVDAGTAGEQ
jgi:DNA-binding Lrp family transcriptional regulator